MRTANARPVLGLLCLCMLALAFCPSAAAVEVGKRVALVIGNGAYDDLGHLPNPPNDARDMVAALEGLHFEVRSVVDGDIDRLQSALRQFGRAAVGAEIALFYYAGHGMALNGENYLLPVGAEINIEPDLVYETMSLSEIQRQLDFTDAALSMIILDACRDNPLGRILQRNAAELGRNINPGEGLARIEVAPASGMLIAYATAPGSLALDGSDNPNSPFTSALLEHIATPNIDVRVMLGRVRSAVVTSTNAFQTPWVEDGMLGEFQFNPVAAEPSPEPLPPPPPEDLVAWREIALSEQPADFQSFLGAHPDSVLAGAARDRLALLNDPEAELDAWEALQRSDDISAHEAFLRRYPSGPFSMAVSLALQEMLWQQINETDDVAGMEAFLERFSSGPFAPVARLRIDQLQSAAGSDAAPAEPDRATASLGSESDAPRALTLVEDQTTATSATTENATAADAGIDAEALARTDEVAPNLLQIALAALGHYDGRIDGLFGPASRRAVAAFQEEFGFPVSGDLQPEEIVRLIAAAAETGDADSQNTYGIMFATGAGVVQDYYDAAKWFNLAADRGNSFGQMNLGLLYMDGLGVEQDADRARKLLEEAVKNGRPEARGLLADLN